MATKQQKTKPVRQPTKTQVRRKPSVKGCPVCYRPMTWIIKDEWVCENPIHPKPIQVTSTS